MAFAIVIVASVAMAEIDRMIEQVMTAYGESYSMSTAIGIPPVGGAWFGWGTSPDPPSELITLHAAWDIAFAAGYTLLGFRLYRSIGWKWGAWFWLGLFGAEVCESGLEIVIAQLLGARTALLVLVPILAVITYAKWALLCGLLIAPLLPKTSRKALRSLVGDWFNAFEPHAPQLIGVVAIGVFALVPKPNLFDQYPDVVRTLADPPAGDGSLGDTLLGFGLFAFLSWVLGRLATNARSHSVPLRGPGAWPWIVAPIVVVAAIAIATAPFPLLSRELQYEWRAIAFAAAILVPLFAVVIGDWVRTRRERSADTADTADTAASADTAADAGTAADADTVADADCIPAATAPPPDVPEESHAEIRRLRRAGDLTAGLVVLVFGAGLVRAFAAPVALTVAGEAETTPGALGVNLEYVLLATGVLVATLLPKIVSPIVSRVSAKWRTWREARKKRKEARPSTEAAPDDTKAQMKHARALSLVRKFVVFGAAAGLLPWILWPTRTADALGPVVTIVFIVLLAVLIVWGLRSEVRSREPNAVFAWMGFPRDPVLIVAVVIPLALLLVPLEPRLHPIQPGAPASTEDPLTEERLSVAEAVHEWATDPEWAADPECTVGIEVRVPVETDGPTTRVTAVSAKAIPAGTRMTETAYVRPMLLVAAEGGGIRAAAWTTRVIDELVASAVCDEGLVFLSSGVSGGSVGLVLSAVAERGDGDTESEPGFDLAKRLARSQPLSATLSGLLVNDLAAEVTGIRVPTEGYPGPNGELIWQDRAAHLQWFWGREVTALKRPFDTGRNDAVGSVILNSSAVGYDCRVVISQVDLELHTRTVVDPRGGARMPSCSGGAPGVANAIDLRELYADCPLNLDWAGAALLSARFPIVSPAGRTVGNGECTRLPDVQLADGGIIDNSGLATIADLTPELMDAVREANAQIEVSTAEHPYIVPIVVYISNSPGGDISAAQVSPWTDVQIAGNAQPAGHSAQNSDRAWLQRIAAQIAQACSDARCTRAVKTVQTRIGRGVAVVAPRTSPTVTAPLGWALSEVSLRAIDDEVEDLMRVAARRWPTGYGELAHVVEVLNAGYPSPTCRKCE